MVRKAGTGDAERIAEIHISGWRAAYRGIVSDAFLFGRLSVCRRAENVRRELAESAAAHYVAERGGAVGAFMAIGEPRDEDKAGGGSLELWAIYVEPALRRSGLGAELLEFFEAEAARLGRAEATLWVLELNASGRAFYEKHGYRPDGGRKTLERLPPAGGGPVTELRYAKRLSAAHE